jgi:hypothetical protein
VLASSVMCLLEGPTQTHPAFTLQLCVSWHSEHTLAHQLTHYLQKSPLIDELSLAKQHRVPNFPDCFNYQVLQKVTMAFSPSWVLRVQRQVMTEGTSKD